MRGEEPILLEAEEGDESPRGNPVRSLLLPLWRSRWLIAVTVAVGGGVGLFMGTMQPNTYRSSGKLLLRPGLREQVTIEDPVTGGRSSGTAPRDITNTELHLLRVPSLFESAARAVTPPALFAAYDPTAMDGEDTPKHLRLFHSAQAWWFGRGAESAEKASGHALDGCDHCVAMAAEALEKVVDIHAEPFSSVITISYAATDPRLARKVVQALLEAAEERHRQAFNTSVNAELAAERLESSREAMHAAESALTLFRQNCGLLDYDLKFSNMLQREIELGKLISTDRSRLDELKASEGLYLAKLGEEDEQLMQEIEKPRVANPDYLALKQLILNQQITLKLLDSRVGGTVEEMQRQREAIQQLIDGLVEDLKDVPAFIQDEPQLKPSPNPRYEAYLQQLVAVRKEMGELESRLPNREEELRMLRDELAKAVQCGPEYRDLESKAREAQVAYESAFQQHKELSQLSDLDERGLANLQTIKDATLPRDKEGPRRAKLLLVGLILGFLGGGAVGFLRQMTDSTIRSPADVERLLGLQVVGVLPRSRLPRRLRRAMQRAAL